MGSDEPTSADRSHQPISGHEEGFSLLEALVAVALTAIALLPLLSLQQANLDLAIRTDRASKRLELERNVLVVVNSVNPSQNPTGTVEIAPYEIRWTSRIIGPPRAASGRPFGSGRFNLTLYDVSVESIDKRTGEIGTTTLRRVGYLAVRPPADIQNSGQAP